MSQLLDLPFDVTPLPPDEGSKRLKTVESSRTMPFFIISTVAVQSVLTLVPFVVWPTHPAVAPTVQSSLNVRLYESSQSVYTSVVLAL